MAIRYLREKSGQLAPANKSRTRAVVPAAGIRVMSRERRMEIPPRWISRITFLRDRESSDPGHSEKV
jgi:hypothetical protein